jgi:hypothetical protein
MAGSALLLQRANNAGASARHDGAILRFDDGGFAGRRGPDREIEKDRAGIGADLRAALEPGAHPRFADRRDQPMAGVILRFAHGVMHAFRRSERALEQKRRRCARLRIRTRGGGHALDLRIRAGKHKDCALSSHRRGRAFAVDAVRRGAPVLHEHPHQRRFGLGAANQNQRGAHSMRAFAPTPNTRRTMRACPPSIRISAAELSSTSRWRTCAIIT